MGNFNIDRIYDITAQNIFNDEVWSVIQSSIYELLKRKAKENQVLNIYDDKLFHYASEIFTHYRETHEIYDFNYKHLDDFIYFVERDIMNIPWDTEGKEIMKQLFKTEDNKTYFENKLNEISLLKKGWILGANTIPNITIENARKLLSHLTNEDLKDWNIAPLVNGSILLYYRTYTKNHATINITESEVSYFHQFPYKCIWDTYKGIIEDGFDKVVNLIKNIHETNK